MQKFHRATGKTYTVWRRFGSEGTASDANTADRQASNSPEPVVEIPTVLHVDPPTPTVEESLPARLISQESGFAPFETLFHDLGLTAEATYNFWEQGEETTAPARGVQILEDLPRYVRLKWNQAPAIKDQKQFFKDGLMSPNPDTRNANSEPAAFGLGAMQPVGVTTMGLNWSPPALQPDNFEQIVNSTSNGYMAPGVIEAVVTVPTDAVTLPPMPSAAIIDEDEFLAHADQFEGLSYPELNAAIWRWESRTIGSQQKRMMQSAMSPAASEKMVKFVDRQFVSPAQSQGYLDLKSVSANGPAISFSSALAKNTTVSEPPRPLKIAEQIGMVELEHPLQSTATDKSVKVKFVHTNIQGAFSAPKVNTITKPEQAESIIALAPFAGNLAVFAASGYQNEKREPMIPSFPFFKLVK